MPFAFDPLIHIEGRPVGPSAPVLIIAEIGLNHNGDLDLARRLVAEAARCGVDAVKLQSYRTEEFVGSSALVHEYVSRGEMIVERQDEMFRRLQMPAEWHAELFARARDLGLIPITSVADIQSADIADAAGVAAFKLASEDLVNLPLLEHVAAQEKPLILSTGMVNEAELQDAVHVLSGSNQSKVIFLHCVSVYPTPDEEVRLGRMALIGRKTGAIVGYSDHSMGSGACVAAAAMGACVLEKHFTLDRSLPGPDHYLSADAPEMIELVAQVRRVKQLRSYDSHTIDPSPTEQRLRAVFRRSLVAAHDLAPGHRVTLSDLKLQRVGIEGLRYRDAHLIVGRPLRTPVRTGEPVLPAHVGT
ncbi:N-acetylneuraminate synthase [soil metagenome]